MQAHPSGARHRKPVCGTGTRSINEVGPAVLDRAVGCRLIALGWEAPASTDVRSSAVARHVLAVRGWYCLRQRCGSGLRELTGGG